VDTIEGQIRKNKTRLEKRMKTSFAAAAATIDPNGNEPAEEEGAFEIRTKSFPLKPMTAEEAILQMNLLGHSFYVYEDADTGETCVVYKRHADSYGLIVPEKKIV
jgi:putative sigma-54 modulation protein